MKRRLIVVLLSILLVVSLFAGCTQKAQDQDTQKEEPSKEEVTQEPSTKQEEKTKEEVNLVFWKAPHSDVEADIWAPILELYMEENPNVNIEHLVTPWDTWTEKYTTAFASGSPPDVSYMTEGYPIFAESGQLADLSGFMTDEMKDGMYYNDYITYDDKICGVTFIVLTSLMFYNKDLLDEANVTVPTDWDSLQEAAIALTKDTDNDGKTDQWGLVLETNEAYSHHELQFIIQGGGTILNADKTELGFTTPETYKGIQYIYDMMFVHKAMPTIDDYSKDERDQLFFNGKAAMTFRQVQFKSSIELNSPDLNYEVALIPSGPGGDAVYGGAGFLSIAEDSRNKEEAFKFIEFLCEPENASQYLKEVGFFGGFADINEYMYNDDSIMALASKAVEANYSMPVHTQWMGTMSEEVRICIEAIYRNLKDIPTAIEDANEAVKEILAE